MAAARGPTRHGHDIESSSATPSTHRPLADGSEASTDTVPDIWNGPSGTRPLVDLRSSPRLVATSTTVVTTATGSRRQRHRVGSTSPVRFFLQVLSCGMVRSVLPEATLRLSVLDQVEHEAHLFVDQSRMKREVTEATNGSRH